MGRSLDLSDLKGQRLNRIPVTLPDGLQPCPCGVVVWNLEAHNRHTHQR